MRSWLTRPVGAALAAAAVMATAAGIHLADLPQQTALQVVVAGGADSGGCVSSPCATLAYAYTQADPGDVIELGAGTHASGTVAYRPGMEAARVTVRPAQGATVQVRDLTVRASHLLFTGGIKFRSLWLGEDTASPQRIQDIVVDGFVVDHEDSQTTSRNAVMAWATDDVTLKNGSIGNTFAGADVGQESNLLQFSGQEARHNTGWTVDNVRFHDNDSPAGSAAHNECVYALHVVGLTIRNSRFESCTYYGIFFTDFLNPAPGLANVLLENNVFHTPRNTSGANTGYSIDFHDNVAPDGFVFRHNTVENAVALGFQGAVTNGFAFADNLVALGVYTRYDGSFACKSGVTFTNNAFPNSCGTGTTTATETAIRAGWAAPSTTWGVADDLRLTASSPAVSAGSSGGLPATDFAGVTRDNPSDAGAYELVTVPDSTPPTTPSGLTATGQLGQVALSWGASTDNIGVTGYRVHRSTTAGFTPGDGNLVATVSSPLHNDSTAVPGTTYYYRVIARDAADNRSDPSNEASAAATAGGGGDTANVWVDNSTGDNTCTANNTTPQAYSSAAACSTFDAALDAASSGGTIRVKAATYGAQSLTGDKTSETTFLVEPGTAAGQLVMDAAHVTIDGLTNNGNTTVGASDVTLRDYDLHGLEPDVFISGARFTWDGGEFGYQGWNPVDRDFCGPSAEPIVLNGAVDSTFQDVNFYGSDAVTNPSCNHMELFRIDEGGSGFRLLRVWVEPGDGSNTATVFLTRPTAGGSYTGLTIANSFFGDNDASSGALQVHSNVASCTNFTLAYNTYVAYPYSRDGCTTRTNWRITGNLGPYATSSPCDGTHVQNRWQYGSAGSCGSDSWTTGPNFGVGNLGFDLTTGALNAGSPAIDDAETDSGSDYCTGELGSIDRLGGSRPVGAACDAGSDERP